MIRHLFILLIVLLSLQTYAQQQSLRYEIRYRQNKYELSEQNKKIITAIFDTLQDKSNYVVYINGHTDSDADSSYNQQLSLKRCLEVKSFLIAKGIDETLIKTQAIGEEQPLVENSTPLQKAKNRRVEIIVLFPQNPYETTVAIKNEKEEENCNKDTTVTLEGGYVITLSTCDWETNSKCLRIIKQVGYKIHVKENWLKKHIGFKNYKKFIAYEPYYNFYVIACLDSCFKNKLKLFIPQYKAIGFNISERYAQKKNDKNQSTSLVFKKAKLGDSAYYVATIYCPGQLRCGTDNRCTHDVILYAKNKINILSYSYYTWNPFFYKDSIKTVIPIDNRKLIDNYRNTFFQSLSILYKGDTIHLKNIPIDVFAHGTKKIKTKGSKYDQLYFLFIPYRKRYKCGHFKKYKIRARDIENLKQFNFYDLIYNSQELE